VNLKRDDKVVIQCQGRTVEAVVQTALNYGTDEDPDWYIEGIRKQDGRGFYWKQKIDGGTVTKL
jgi:hypothetical protein